MTAGTLAAGVVVGLVVGLAGQLLAARRRDVPLWLFLAVGVGAALLATIVALLANPGRPGPTMVDVLLQVLFAGAAVGLVAVTARRTRELG
ncbi:GlsB/YeaQ/YmgE family stress response membrane protein [Actinoplanes sp. GCM10030250]|uniref:GlsB/YeaQ/YmgE family stress response membrane protein n=1 Tax=Actinoplanes sp. GCM10030250 TaxID=3273376 RepID=UPI00360A12EA